MKVPFLNLTEIHRPLKAELMREIEDVIDNSCFALGPKVAAFEEAFASYCNCNFAVGVNSGTSALHMALLAGGIGPGDEVIVPAMSFTATAEAVRYAGAKPVFVDILPGTYTINPALIEDAITDRTKAIMPVHLYGLMADMPAITAIAAKHGIMVIEDAAQAHGAELDGKRAGEWGTMGCFSFYPGKNLGAIGEAGAIVTSDESLLKQLQILRDWGQDGRYNHVRQGFNTRMSGIQGAALKVKLQYLEGWLKARNDVAGWYNKYLSDIAEITLPKCPEGYRHVYHIYAIQVDDRDRVREMLNKKDVQSGIHYPQAIPALGSFSDMDYHDGDFPVAEELGRHELSLPMCPTLTEDHIRQAADVLKNIFAAKS